MIAISQSKKFSRDVGAIAGAMLMAAFASLAGWRWAHTGSLFFGLLLFRDSLLAMFFAFRKKAIRAASRKMATLAYVSTALPLCYIPSAWNTEPWRWATADFLAIGGFLLATLATIELGSRIGVSPAVRGDICRTGVYRWFPHPMYFGYMIAEVGWVLIAPVNIAIFALSAACYCARISAENDILHRGKVWTRQFS